VYECPPSGQGLTALLALNILEGFDLASMNTRPDLYYHTLIEATKLAFADRNRYIADPAFAKVPIRQLLSKEYATSRRALINPDHAIETPQAGVVLHDRGAGFSLDPAHPNHIEPGKRPFHTIIPAMVFKDGKLFMSFGVMGGAIQPQGHVQVLTNLIDLGMNLQQAIEAPRFRYLSGNRVILEDAMTDPIINSLIAKGHQRATQSGASMGGGQAIMIDPATGALMGGSDPRKDGMALGY
jgi:gamma-glutamyltranspeptidase/glutathione hydrolase